MIFTCTLNPSIDYVMNVDSFQAGELNRAEETFYYPGGKGINVSRVMARLGVKTTALGFTGGFTGEFIHRFLSEENVDHQFISTEHPTRVNVKLKNKEETEINGPGPKLSIQQKNQLLDQIRSMDNEDILIVAGSAPSSLAEDFFVNIAHICNDNGTKLVVDTSGKALEQMLGTPLFLLKPNHHELGELFQTTVDTKEKAVEYGQRLLEKEVEHVIVSMGGEGAVYVGKHHQLFAEVPKGDVKNSVGAGDSVVSGFMTAITNQQPIEEAFRYGVAAGSATAFQDDLCQKDDVEQLINEVKIHSI